MSPRNETGRCTRCGSLRPIGPLVGHCPYCLLEAGLAEGADETVDLPEDPRESPLPVGFRIGPYQIEDVLGAGGMGQVYSAMDTRLGRRVAIKFLSAAVADATGRRRFQREAQMASSLNHPHILTVHDAGEFDGRQYLVTEFVDGGTLSEWARRQKRQPREIADLLAGVADGLAAAHAANILHRDIKPANVLVAKSGYAKLADFGLAKLAAGVIPGEATSPSAEAATRPGVIVGTIAYMSPEQASSRAVDARSDVFSFGVLLYELLAGHRPFAGSTDLELLQNITHGAPQPLGEEVPPMLRMAMEKALEKDPDDRYQSMRELAVDLRRFTRAKVAEPLPRAETQAPARVRFGAKHLWLLCAIGITALLAIGSALWIRGRVATGRQPVKFTFGAPVDTELITTGTVSAALSPDGQRLAFIVQERSGVSAIWIRPLDSEHSQRIAGTDDASSLFWSPDGQFLGFFAQGRLKKIALAGGPPQNICISRAGLGGTWNSSGDIVFNPRNRAPLMRVPASGGTPQQLTTLDTGRQENSHRWPSFLPDGRHFLFTARSSEKRNTAIYIGSLDSKDTKRLLTEQSNAVFTLPGDLLFVRDGTLMAQHFDVRRLELSGEAFPVAANVLHTRPSAEAFFTASIGGGVIAYSEATPSMVQLTWFDRRGKKAAAEGPRGSYTSPRISPDGKLSAIVIPDSDTGNRDIWVADLKTGLHTRLTSNPANDWYPVWSPDGKYIAFASDRTPRSSIYRKAIDGSPEEGLLVPGPDRGGAFLTDWSRDGRYLLYQVDTPDGGIDLWTFPLVDRKPRPFLATQFQEIGAKFSPDGKWVAYASNESGAMEVYVTPFDRPGKQRVSTNGGSQPAWRSDGEELFFLSRNILMSVGAKTDGDTLRLSAPAPLFQVCQIEESGSGSADYDVTTDGQRFLFPCQLRDSEKPSITVAIQSIDMARRRPQGSPNGAQFGGPFQ